MFNLKLTIGSAAFGLIASFFLGLLGGNLLYIVLLRSLLCSVILGGAMTLASFVFRKFLADGSFESASGESSSSTGSLVDITIGEDVLPDSDNAPDFYVSQNYTKTHREQETASSQPLEQPAFKATSVEQPVSNVESGGTNSTFVPTSLAQEKYTTNVSSNNVQNNNASSNIVTSNTVQRDNAVSPSVSNSPKQKSFTEDSSDSFDSLDSLPDMNDVFSESKPQNSEVIEDSAFATGQANPASDFVPDSVMGADASLMAEAIKTLLKREG